MKFESVQILVMEDFLALPGEKYLVKLKLDDDIDLPSWETAKNK